MQDKKLIVRASTKLLKFWLIFGVIGICFCIWTGYLFVQDTRTWQTFFIAIMITLLYFGFALVQLTEVMIFENARLRKYNLFTSQSVDLSSLTKAIRYQAFAANNAGGPARLQLEDAAGGKLIVSPDKYGKEDLSKIVEYLHPYIFITRVDKNFMDLRFYTEEPSDVPPISAQRVLRNTFLYMLLPFIGIIGITLALVVWLD